MGFISLIPKYQVIGICKPSLLSSNKNTGSANIWSKPSFQRKAEPNKGINSITSNAIYWDWKLCQKKTRMEQQDTRPRLTSDPSICFSPQRRPAIVPRKNAKTAIIGCFRKVTNYPACLKKSTFLSCHNIEIFDIMSHAIIARSASILLFCFQLHFCFKLPKQILLRA